MCAKQLKRTVLQIDSLENVSPLCETLINEGINIIELALRTNVSQKASNSRRSFFTI